MALVSPGIEVSISDESNYIPAGTASVPFILVATAQNKASGTDATSTAAGTTAANANQTYLITSQRDLVSTFGNPFFYQTSNGTPIHGYELNEYGLLAAYSVLGVSNRAYVQRVDIDLAELTASLTRPTGDPDNGAWWFDVSESSFGLFSWNSTTQAFSEITPTVITSTDDLSAGVPKASIGAQGDYAIVATNTSNPVYYKNTSNDWVLVGSDDWKNSWPTITGSEASATVTVGHAFYINDVQITASGTTLTSLASDIVSASVPGVTATVNSANKLVIYADGDATNDGSSGSGGTVSIQAISGTILADIGISAGTYYAPQLEISQHYNVPSWRTTGSAPAVTGSVWFKTTSVNNGANLVVKQYSSATDTFTQVSAPIYEDQAYALNDLDSTGGGRNIADGAVFVQYDTNAPHNAVASGTGPFYVFGTDTGTDGYYSPVYTTAAAANTADSTAGGSGTSTATTFDEFPGTTFYIPTTGSTLAGASKPSGIPNYLASTENADTSLTFKIFERNGTGSTTVTGESINNPPEFVSGETFTISATTAGSNSYTTEVTATMAGTTAADFVEAFSAAGVANTIARVTDTGAVQLTHTLGGTIKLKDQSATKTPVEDAGFFETVDGVTKDDYGYIYVSNWIPLGGSSSYTASTTAPDQNPTNGRKWYYSDSTVADIMIHDGSNWKGYQNVSQDVRGFDLSATSPAGPIMAATAPTQQSDETALVYGDLWVDTGDLENYPAIYRWESVDSVDQWVAIDTADATTENGILFADARWAANGTTDPVAGDFPEIDALQSSDYLDIDAPNPALYPTGTLLWNTRRSGFNVKEFRSNYFNGTDFPDDTLPTEKDAWVSVSGNRDDGSMYAGRKAVRQIVIAAMKAGIDTNNAIREEQREFNLIAAPGYPELVANMVTLNNDRNNTAFVVADTPVRLAANGTELVAYANDTGTLDDSITTSDAYLGVFYPSAQTNDLSGNTVTVPPSHMMLRTMIRSDEIAFPWLAPAGVRRGTVDNATRLGYIDADTGEFQTTAIRQGLRDTLYENDINPITLIPGTGIMNYGNKTKFGTSSAMDRINVARLVAYIRGRLQTIANNFLFEPNDKITRDEVKNSVEGLMNDLVAKRGIYDYLVVCDETNNTPARIDRNELYCDIAIEPVKAVEFIYIPVRIKNTGDISAGL